MSNKKSELQVEHFMTRNPVTTHSNVNFPGGIDIMITNDISNLIVMEDMKPIGILTEREILHYLSTYKAVPTDKLLKDISIQQFCKVNLYTSLLEAARKMITKKCRILVFNKSNSRHQDNGEVVGIITASDMVRAFAEQKKGDQSLKSVMTKKLFFVSTSASIYDAINIMHNRNVGSVIVVANSKSDSIDSKKKEIYGIFTERDLLRRVLSNDVSLDMDVKEYCSTELVTADMGINAVEAAKIMLLKKIKRLPLVTEIEAMERGKLSRSPEIIQKDDKHRLAGIVTARDLVEIFQINS